MLLTSRWIEPRMAPPGGTLVTAFLTGATTPSAQPQPPYTCSMLRIRAHQAMKASVLIVLAGLFFQPPSAHAWGNEGHRLINRLAVVNLPADAPAFLRSEAAISEIEYLVPEPDRWRSPAEAELSAVQAPEHFIDLEPADALGPLPRRRHR